jgi:GTP pyrophosphokinase
MADSGEMLDEVRSQVFDDRVYVFTPKGDVVDLPAGSTPLDFAYHIHSDVGHRCIGAKIGGRIVPFTYQLQMGDQIEIITQKQPNPSRDWLNPNLGYVTTSRGRSKIHAWFRKQDRDKNILAGRQILDDELEHLGISLRMKSTCCRATTSTSSMNCWRPLAAAISVSTRWSTSCRRSSINRAPPSRMRPR